MILLPLRVAAPKCQKSEETKNKNKQINKQQNMPVCVFNWLTKRNISNVLTHYTFFFLVSWYSVSHCHAIHRSMKSHTRTPIPFVWRRKKKRKKIHICSCWRCYVVLNCVLFVFVSFFGWFHSRTWNLETDLWIQNGSKWWLLHKQQQQKWSSKLTS